MSDAATGDVVVLHRIIHQTEPADLAATLSDRCPAATVRAAETPAESIEYLRNADIAVGMFMPPPAIEGDIDLGWFQAITAGVDHLPTDYFREQGTLLTTASGVNAIPVAEQVLGYMLAFERDLPRAFEQQARHEFRYWQGGELHGRTLGIIGLGEVGSRVAQLGQALGMTVIGTKRDPGSAPAAVDEALGSGDTDRVCARADYLVLACPLTEDTRGLIGETQLGTMPSDGVLINVARGPVVDEDALIRALQRSEIGGAALDVFTEEPLPGDSPLWDFSNVILTPHIAGSTPKYWDRLADIFAHNYTCYRDGEYDEMQNRAP